MARKARWDKEIVELAARVKFIRAEHVAKRFGMSCRNAYARLRLLSEAGLLFVEKGFPDGWLYGATREGIAFSCLDLAPARFSYATIKHDLAIAEFVIVSEFHKYKCLAERELVAHMRATGDRRYAFEYFDGGREIDHLPDAAFFDPERDRFIAVELELSSKSASRCEAILRSYYGRLDLDGLFGVLNLTGGQCSAHRLRRLIENVGAQDFAVAAANTGEMPVKELRQLIRAAAVRPV